MIKTVIVSQAPSFKSILAVWALRKFGSKSLRGIKTAAVKSRKSEKAIYSDEISINTLIGDDDRLGNIIELCGDVDGKLKSFFNSCMDNCGQAPAVTFKQKAETLTLAKLLTWSVQTLDSFFSEFDKLEKDIPTKKPEVISVGQLMRTARVGRIPPERTIKLRHPNGQEITLGFAVDSAVQFKLDNTVDLAVAITPDATSIVIMSNFSIRSLIRVLRVEELVRKQRSEKSALLASRMWREFAEEGIHPLVPTWNYNKIQQGTRHVITTGVETPFTQLQIEEIINLIRIAVDNRFQPQREHHCLRFRCTATVDLPCPWYHWMLGKCRQVRNASRKEGCV